MDLELAPVVWCGVVWSGLVVNGGALLASSAAFFFFRVLKEEIFFSLCFCSLTGEIFKRRGVFMFVELLFVADGPAPPGDRRRGWF